MPNQKKQTPATTSNTSSTEEQAYFLEQFQLMQAELPKMKQQLDQLHKTELENLNLRKQLQIALNEITQLRKELLNYQNNSQKQQSPPPKITTTIGTQTLDIELPTPPPPASNRSWVNAVKQNLNSQKQPKNSQNTKKFQTQKPKKQSPPTENMLNWAYRGFMENTGPTGYQFIHFKTSSRTNQRTVRKRLAIIGISNKRIIAVQFPTKGLVALLVHNAYAEEIVKILAKGKVTPTEFNPYHESVICDPQHATLSLKQKQKMAATIYHRRMLNLCSRLQPQHVGTSIIRYFNHIEGDFHLPDKVVEKYLSKNKSDNADQQSEAEIDDDEEIPDVNPA